MKTVINGLSLIITWLDYVIAYFQNVRNKHYRFFIEMKMALLIKKTDIIKREKSIMLLVFYTLK